MYDGGPSRDNVNVESPDDGTAGQDAWVGSDVENASILGEPQSGDDLVIGNEGPNVLVGPGTVRGLGGNDILVSDGYAGGGTTLDGRDANDRIDALAWLPDRLPARADPPHHPLSASEHNPPFRVDGDGITAHNSCSILCRKHSEFRVQPSRSGADPANQFIRCIRSPFGIDGRLIPKARPRGSVEE